MEDRWIHGDLGFEMSINFIGKMEQYEAMFHEKQYSRGS